MELLYIWLGKVRDKTKSYVFEEQGFKFTSEFDIRFDNENNELTISENKDYDPDFYKVKKGYEAPFKVTCIVGENGAGKTCLLELLGNLFDNGSISCQINRLYSTYFILLSNDGKLQLYSHELSVNINENSKVNLIADINYNSFYTNKNSICSIYYCSSITNFCKISDKNDLNFDFDISSNYFNCLEKIQINGESLDVFNKFIVLNFNQAILFYYDKNNQVFLNKFFLKNNFKRYYIKVKIGYPNFDLLVNLYKESCAIKQFVKDFSKFIYTKINSNGSNKERILWSIAFYYIYICMIFLSKISISNEDFLTENNFNSLFNKDINSKDLLNLFVKILINMSEFELYLIIHHFDLNFIDIIIKTGNKIYNMFETLLSFTNVVSESSNELYIYLKSNNDNIGELIDVISSIFASCNEIQTKFKINIDDFVSYLFYPRFSSGEASLITLFSRIFYLIKYNNDFINSMRTKRHLYFLIDEAEIGFHPQWCKQYIEILISYIQSLFSKFNVAIHLIITTNNPIVLSDILPDDVIYLKNKTSLTTDKRPKMAFGSNILDLYSDNFFIQDGLIGSFAKRKIEQVVNFIKYFRKYKNLSEGKVDVPLITKKECQFIINNIGDSNLRGFLQSLFNEKLRNEDL